MGGGSIGSEGSGLVQLGLDTVKRVLLWLQGWWPGWWVVLQCTCA
jgi:hypothetical protein